MLLVDDSLPDRILARAMMHRCRPDWAIDESIDADETLAVVRARAPDVVLLDVNMAPEDGFLILQRIRMDPAGETLPVFMHSTSGQDIHRLDARRLGADGYLPKPDSLQGYEVLCATLERVTRGRRPGDAGEDAL